MLLLKSCSTDPEKLDSERLGWGHRSSGVTLCTIIHPPKPLMAMEIKWQDSQAPNPTLLPKAASCLCLIPHDTACHRNATSPALPFPGACSCPPRPSKSCRTDRKTQSAFPGTQHRGASISVCSIEGLHGSKPLRLEVGNHSREASRWLSH